MYHCDKAKLTHPWVNKGCALRTHPVVKRLKG
jgi:hypothetical protein